MPRPSKGPRLYLRRRKGRPATWVIRDGENEVSTGCGESDITGAERALERHIASKYQPPQKAGDRLDDILIADVLNVYLKEHAPHTGSADFIRHTAAPILTWWGEKTLADVKGPACREYVAWRVAQGRRGVSDQTARHDLKTLRAAIRYYHREHGPLPSIPLVTLPEKAPPRERWLTRQEAARLLRAALRTERCRHVARFILIALYTGTRSKAVLALRWMPSVDGGWVDLEAGVLHRRGKGQRETRKRQPPVRLPPRLAAHMARWRAEDAAQGIVHIVHYYGQPVSKLRRSWSTVREAAGLDEDVVPHTLRHTAATWLMQSGVDIFEAAGFLGMSPETLEEVYGHHHPDFQENAAKARRRRA